MAAIACAPPTLYIAVTPTNEAAYKIAGLISPCSLGGVHKITSLQPAIFAGMPNINTVENKGADPPGIYIPTFSIPTDFLQHQTPGIVSIRSTFCIWLL